VPDLYAVLGVPRDASPQQIKKAYRKLAAELHPDKKPGKAGEQKFKEASSAYQVLSDPNKRALYDEFGEESLRVGFDAPRARAARRVGVGAGGGLPFDLGDLFGGGGGGIGDVFGDLLRRGRAPRQQRGQDVTARLSIPFLDAVRGATTSFSIGDESVQVRIPAGAADGDRVRVRGKGGQGAAGGPRGDLVLELAVEPHPSLRREGDDLHLDVPVTLGEAFAGAQILVPTAHGEVKLTVPRGTQSGRKVRLRGKGAQRRGRTPGDLYVRFLVMYPSGDDEEIAGAIETLARHETDPRANLKL
jgi:curved DNA-binding protein